MPNLPAIDTQPSRRRLRALVVPAAASLIIALLALDPADSQAATPPNPAANLEIGTMPQYCARHAEVPSCANGYIYYLDQARGTMGLGPYALPANFLSMAPEQQMFILSNLDRIVYSRPPIVGLNSGLDAAAAFGAYEDEDPIPPPGAMGQLSFGFASNWAGGFPSALDAYFSWMYADGYGSENLACNSPTDPGCWGHRQDFLWEEESSQRPELLIYSMGASATKDRKGTPAYATTIVDSLAETPPPYYYTWAQAVAEGAGTNVYAVTAPVEEKVQVSIAFEGKGSVAGDGFTCDRSCVERVTEYEPLTLFARAADDRHLVSWQGCARQKGVSCTVEPSGDMALQVSFATRIPGPRTSSCMKARAAVRNRARRHRRLVRLLRGARGARERALRRLARGEASSLHGARRAATRACR